MAIKKQNSNEFYAAMSKHAREQKIPSRVMFELTYRCNFRCLHCYLSPDKKKELNTKEVFLVLDQLKDAGTFHIGFTGGEPFLRRDLFQILDHAKKCGFRISLLTNGFLIDKDNAKKLAALGPSLNRVDISVLGANPKTFEKITGVKGSFNKVMDSIGLLKKEGVVVQLKSTLMTLNKDELLEIRALAKKFDCLFRYGPTVSRKADGDDGPLKYQVSPDEVLRINRQLAGDHNKIGDKKNGCGTLIRKTVGRRSLFHCGAGQTEVTISPYGEMNFCLEIHYPQYDILKTSLLECWGRLSSLVGNVTVPQEYACGACDIADFCHWCPAKAWHFKKDFFSCDPESKKMAICEARACGVVGE